MNVRKLKTVIGAITPIVTKLIKDAWDLSREDSDGGRTITQGELEQLRADVGRLADVILGQLGVTIRVRGKSLSPASVQASAPFVTTDKLLGVLEGMAQGIDLLALRVESLAMDIGELKREEPAAEPTFEVPSDEVAKG